jgi:hypothetical protein
MIILAPEKLGEVDPPLKFGGPVSFSAPVSPVVSALPGCGTTVMVMRATRNIRYGPFDLCVIFALRTRYFAQYY